MKYRSIHFATYILLIVVIIVALVSACSSSATTSPTQSSVPGGNSNEPSSSAAMLSSLASVPISAVITTDTMFQYIVKDGGFTILVSAITTTNLLSKLQNYKPFTAFAPSDAAFQKLPPLTLEAILNDNAKLEQLLFYHIVQGSYPSNKLTPPLSLETIEGEKVNIRMVDYEIMVNDAKFVFNDVEAADGIVHIIDKVLIPPSWSLASPSRSPTLPQGISATP